MARHRRAVIITWLLVAFAAAPLALTLTGALSGAGWEAQGSTAQAGARRAPPRLPAARRREPGRRLPPADTDRDRSRRPRSRSSRSSEHAPHARARRRTRSRFPPAPGSSRRDGHTALIPVDPDRARTTPQRPVAAGALGSYVGRLHARVRRAGEGDRRVAGVERLQQDQRRSAPQGRAGQRPADA